MKRRSNLRIEAILLSAGLALAGLSRSAVWPVLAEEQSEGAQSDTNAEIVEEPDTKAAPEPQEEAAEPESQGLLDSLEIVEDEKTELILPQGHVPVPVSEFLPVQEREDMLFLNPHEDLYLLHIMNDSDEKVGYTVFLNQALEESDVALYCFDSEKNQVTDAQPVEGVLQFLQKDTVLSLDADASSDYLLVISHAGQYEELGYTAKLSEVQPQDATEADTAEDESEAMTGEMDQESGTAAVLDSVRVDPDPELETVPAAFAGYLDGPELYSITLCYSDGSELPLGKEDERYTVSVNYTDEKDEAGAVTRTYHAAVTEHASGRTFEAAGSITFGVREPVEIRTEEMTTVALEGKRKWAMVQSVPAVTGRYALNSDQAVECMYYMAEDGDGEVIRAEDAFRLQAGVTYRFLIKLS